MAAKAGKRPLRSLSPHEKLEAIRRVHDGESKASVARDIGVPESTLRGWCKNEEKISYLTRQSSSPDTDGSAEPKAKRQKSEDASTSSVVQPFSLNVKGNSSTYSPSESALLYTNELAKNGNPPIIHTPPQGSSFNARADALKQITPPTLSDKDKLKSSDLTARMTADIMSHSSPLTNSNVEWLAQWGAIMHQHYFGPRAQQLSKKSAPLNIDVSTTNVPTSTSTSQSLLTTVRSLDTQINNSKYTKEKSPKSPTEDNLCLWLKQHAALNMAQTYTHLNGGLSATNERTPTSTNSNGNNLASNNISPNSTKFLTNSSYANAAPDSLLNWYKLAVMGSLPQTQVQPHYPPATSAIIPIVSPVDKPILYQQLTKEKDKCEDYSEKEQIYAEDLSVNSQGKFGKNSIRSFSINSRSSNVSPSNTSTSSLSVPSPTSNLPNSSVDIANSPESSSSSNSLEVTSTIQNQVTSIFNGVNNATTLNGKISPRRTNGKTRNGKVLKPKRQINALLAEFENHNDSQYSLTNDSKDDALSTDWSTLINCAQTLLRSLEAGKVSSVTHFQVGQLRNILAQIKAKGELEERRKVFIN